MGAILKKEKCYSLQGFPDKVLNISKSEKVEPKNSKVAILMD